MLYYRRLYCLALLFALPALADDLKPEPVSEYDRFMQRYKADDKIILKVTTITGDRELTEDELAGLDHDARATKVFNQQMQLVSHGNTISSEWHVDYFEHSSMSDKGAGGITIPESDRKRLTELISALPEDEKNLPAPDRRVLIQARMGGDVKARVYDRAKLPDKILELLRLSEGAVASWSPSILSAGVIQSDKENEGAFCVFPNGTRMISASEHGPLKIWGASTHDLLQTIEVIPRECIKGIVLSPDGTLAAIQSTTDCYVFEAGNWKMVEHFPGPSTPGVYHCLSNFQFSADGSTLMMQSSEPKVYTYDTKLWNTIATPPGLPVDARLLIQTRKTKRALIASKDGKMELWDMDSRKRYAVLDENAISACAAFSPDESMVVVSPGYVFKGSSIHIWDMATGVLFKELRPFDARLAENVEGLTWSPDGQYVLGAITTSASDARHICVWNVKSGRQRGTLDDSDGVGPVSGMGLLENGRTLVAGDRRGKIHFWNLDAALKTIREFEASLDRKSGK